MDVQTQPSPPVPATVADRCLNCEATLLGPFCSECGQQAGEPLPTVQDFAHDIAEEYFKFDTRLGRTLKPLLTQPGFLTAEFAAGRKSRYITPFKLYFGCSFVFFFVSSYATSMTTPFKARPEVQPVIDGMRYYLDHLAAISICFIPLTAFVLQLFFLRDRRPLVFYLVLVLHVYSAGYLSYIPIVGLNYLLTRGRVDGVISVLMSGLYMASISV